ncbi:MAG: Spy/CpxP family protein refolding chaperone [Xenococcus sp. MO_188.B8]|nr:Spy/CpxP family protein refolding chaperone [Xenococcus sp. MO_188.B8]
MTKLSKIIMANALAIISVLGLSFKVDARLTKVEQLGDISSTDGSLGTISQVRDENMTAGLTTGADKLQIAQMYSQKRRRHKGEGLQKFLERLDLSEEQSSQIKAIYRRYYQANQESRQELQEAREEMRSLLTSEANPNRIRRKHREIQSLNQELGNSRFEAMLKVREVLTREQRQEIADMMAEYRGRRGYYRR